MAGEDFDYLEAQETLDIKKMKCGTTVVAFYNGYCPFSLFHIAKFRVEGIMYRSVQQYLTAEAARLFKDRPALNSAKENGWNPIVAKNIMEEIEFFRDETWNSHLEDFLMKGLKQKISKNAEVMELLLKTGDLNIVYASSFDEHIGCGHFVNEFAELEYKNLKGQNLLGKVLMDIRSESKETPSVT